MPQQDFVYDAPVDAAGLPATISLVVERDSIRSELTHDLRDAGFKLGSITSLEELLAGDLVLLGDAVLLDCQTVDARTLAALARLDERIARSGTPLIVMTSMEALDDVFVAFDQAAPQILVDSGRAERMVAVGRILGRISGLKLRELSETEQMTLMRLTEQVEAIARRIDEFAERQSGEGGERLSDKKRDFRGVSAFASGARPALPKAAIVRKIIQHRQDRARFFDGELFADPAWDMLLDLTAADSEGQQVCVSSLCIAAGVPATTALRWIRQMVEQGIFTRVEDENDKRRAFIALSENSRHAMARYFASIEEPLALAA